MASFPGFDSPAYGTIGGSLPWGGGNSAGQGMAAAATGNVAGVAQSYQSGYNSALAMNQGNYNNILAGYQQTLAGHSTAQQAIQTGYSSLYNDVLAKISDVGQARSNQINADSSRSLASGSQQLVNRGLGNTTITSSLGRGVEYDRNQQQLALSDSLAQMQAGYMSSLGQAGLQNQQYGLDKSTNLAQGQLDWMNSVNAKYPDAGLYGSLAQQAGQNAGNRQSPYGAYGGGSFGGVSGPKLGYTPAGGRYETSGMGPGSVGGSGGSWMMDQYSGASGAGAAEPASVYASYGGGGLGMIGSAVGGGGSYGGYGEDAAMSGFVGGASPGDLFADPSYGGGEDF